GLVSGHYKLEFFASDEAGNVSPRRAVDWTQTILPPPIRQQADMPSLSIGCDPCDSQCPGHYALQVGSVGGTCVVLGTADAPITGALVPAGQLHGATGIIDNPGPLAVRVRFEGHAQATWSRGTIWAHPVVVESGAAQKSCQDADADPMTCYDALGAASSEAVV